MTEGLTLDELIQRFNLERSKISGNPLQTGGEFPKLLVELDKFYWDSCEKLIREALTNNPDRLFFNKYERFLIDCGLIDDRLVPANPQQFKTTLTRELYSEEEAPNCGYFSQWLAERYRAFLLIKKFGQETGTRGKRTYIEPLEMTKLKKMRDNLYKSLEPLFKNLPGINQQVADLLPSGKLDANIELLSIKYYYEGDKKISEQRDKLLEIKRKLFNKVKTFCQSQQELLLFDTFTQIDERIHEEFTNALRKGTFSSINPLAAKHEEEGAPVPMEERVEFLLSELKLVKSLLKLGTPGSGISKTYSVLVSDQKRITNADVAAIMQNIKEIDPNLPGNPNMLIAPYSGTGFFEWDRDTIFIPLISTRTEEESVVNAVGNYRIMMDNLHDNSRLKQSYEAVHGKGIFRNNFLKDYKNWVLGVCKGFKGSMTQECFGFFKEYIGPSPDNLYGPRELAMLTPDERKKMVGEIRAKINRGEAEFEEHYKMAILYWKENRPQESLDQMAIAVKMNPADGRAMFTLGYMCKVMDKPDKALSALRETLNIAPNTIWHIYASDVLKKI